MKLTNKNNFPEALLMALKNDTYSKGGSDFSATELLQPPRIRQLKIDHSHELEEDVEDRLWSLYGQLAHALLERANVNGVVEARFVAHFGNFSVSAQIDSLSLKSGVLADWKFATAWKFKPGKPPPDEYVQQMNIQAEILRRNDVFVSSLKIVGLLRDFSKPEARRNPDYPQSPVIEMPIPLWSREDASRFINERISIHSMAKERLPECSKDERWAKDVVYALMKRGNKRAVKLFTDRVVAEEIAKNTPGHFVEDRPGESVRCELYCPVAKFCQQFQKEKGVSDDKARGTVA